MAYQIAKSNAWDIMELMDKFEENNQPQLKSAGESFEKILGSGHNNVIQEAMGRTLLEGVWFWERFYQKVTAEFTDTDGWNRMKLVQVVAG